MNNKNLLLFVWFISEYQQILKPRFEYL